MLATQAARDDLPAHADFHGYSLFRPAEIDGPTRHNAVANRVDKAFEHVGENGLTALRELQVSVDGCEGESTDYVKHF
jgi:hypothetical protein